MDKRGKRFDILKIKKGVYQYDKERRRYRKVC